MSHSQPVPQSVPNHPRVGDLEEDLEAMDVDPTRKSDSHDEESEVLTPGGGSAAGDYDDQAARLADLEGDEEALGDVENHELWDHAFEAIMVLYPRSPQVLMQEAYKSKGYQAVRLLQDLDDWAKYHYWLQHKKACDEYEEACQEFRQVHEIPETSTWTPKPAVRTLWSTLSTTSKLDAQNAYYREKCAVEEPTSDAPPKSKVKSSLGKVVDKARRGSQLFADRMPHEGNAAQEFMHREIMGEREAKEQLRAAELQEKQQQAELRKQERAAAELRRQERAAQQEKRDAKNREAASQQQAEGTKPARTDGRKNVPASAARPAAPRISTPAPRRGHAPSARSSALPLAVPGYNYDPANPTPLARHLNGAAARSRPPSAIPKPRTPSRDESRGPSGELLPSPEDTRGTPEVTTPTPRVPPRATLPPEAQGTSGEPGVKDAPPIPVSRESPDVVMSDAGVQPLPENHAKGVEDLDPQTSSRYNQLLQQLHGHGALASKHGETCASKIWWNTLYKRSDDEEFGKIVEYLQLVIQYAVVLKLVQDFGTRLMGNQTASSATGPAEEELARQAMETWWDGVEAESSNLTQSHTNNISSINSRPSQLMADMALAKTQEQRLYVLNQFESQATADQNALRHMGDTIKPERADAGQGMQQLLAISKQFGELSIVGEDVESEAHENKDFLNRLVDGMDEQHSNAVKSGVPFLSGLVMGKVTQREQLVDDLAVEDVD